ncbi:LADA_0H10990g1_1 [Lachancea dasiensis]|uniref:Vacuolar ATPase assembly protein VMA22 n=1 Tax=Lachancea dasiensis TaxID=1072105 RepID=A0A1G4K3A5_9SACH|nr:LADA_0H10990g1_1 [Lachancea dasiensis]
MLSEDKCVELLELLAHYDGLLEQFQVACGDGFFQLSRANYHNKDAIRERYGKDYWDETYRGSRFVSIEGTKFTFKDSETVEQYLAQFEEVEHEGSDQAQEEKTVRRRKETKDSAGVQKTKRATKAKDPIFMFGGALSIPSSLRQCQSSFKGSTELILELVNCRKKIEALKP